MAEKEIVEPIVVEPIVGTEKKVLPVPNFNKKEIEEIVRETVKNKISSYPDCKDILEIDGDSHTLTDEVYAFILKCFEVEKISTGTGSYLLNLNFADVDSAGDINSLCFGCKTTAPDTDHSQNGCHLEIEIDHDNKTYKAYIAEV